MQAPDIPPNEEARLLALHQLNVLDTANEAAFDDIARLAAWVVGAPIALVSFVDAHRQWFKARFGLDVQELPRQLSFCGHVVSTDSPLVVGDALLDVRFADNPIVLGDPRIRFYAGMPLRLEDGSVIGTLCVIDQEPRCPSAEQLEMLTLLARQVTRLLEKRRLRLQLADENVVMAETKNQLLSVIEVMAEGLVVQDHAGEILSCNDAATSILGLSKDQMRGRTSIDPRWRSVREDGSDFPGADHPAMQALRTGERQRNVVMGVQIPDGTLTWISINSLPSRVTDGVVDEVVTTFHDITPIKLAAERMAQQERLATTGTLVAGVGHEINNPLAFLIGNLDLALEEVSALAGPSPSARMRELAEMLGEARLGADRIRKIVRGLRTLSREDVALQAVDIATVVDTSVSMALHELRRKASVTVDVAGLPAVLGDESRLTQVLVNLLVNAGQAFERHDPEFNRVIVRGTALGGDRVRLSVIDNGPGIPTELCSRVFDPFFTTKEVGQGTGLGLAVSRGLVQALGGALTLESVPGEGASFHIDLKAAEDVLPHEAYTEPASHATRGRILLLDDDPSVLSTMRRSLAREHDVTAITDPRDALPLFASGARFDVIFCDLMMPHLTGQDLFAVVQQHYPEVAAHFVFVTGGATTSGATLFLSQLPNDVVEKPFSLTSLLGLARRYVLRRPAA
jgi:PAS domain S-box-containing protein